MVKLPTLTAERRLLIARILALAVVIGLSVFIYSIRDQAEQLARYGYPGIFVLSIMANATVLLPAPGILFVFAMGAVLHPAGVALAAASGAALGELSGYLAGFSGQAVAQRTEAYERIRSWMKDHPQLSYLAIMLMAFIPNPLFDLAGFAAGTLKMPVGKFLFWCWLGKLLKMLAIAYAGASSLDRLFHLPP